MKDEVAIFIALLGTGWTVVSNILKDKKNEKPEEKQSLTKFDKILKWGNLIVPILLMLAGILLIAINSSTESEKRIAAIQEQIKIANEKDSISKEAEKHKALLRYYHNELGLKIDSTKFETFRQNELTAFNANKRYIDSLKSITSIINSKAIKRPTFYIPTFHTVNKKDIPEYVDSGVSKPFLKHYFYSLDNVSYNVALYYKIFSCDFTTNLKDNGYYYNNLALIQDERVFLNKENAPSDIEAYTHTFINSTVNQTNYILVIIYGTYSDKIKNGEIYDYTGGYIFNMKSKKVETLLSPDGIQNLKKNKHIP